jgi:hypothetical protein
MQSMTDFPANLSRINAIRLASHDTGAAAFDGFLRNAKASSAMGLRVHINEKCSTPSLR